MGNLDCITEAQLRENTFVFSGIYPARFQACSNFVAKAGIVLINCDALSAARIAIPYVSGCGCLLVQLSTRTS